MDTLGGSPEDFAARIRTEVESMSKVMREAGLRLN
jgi:hypothetical protein